MDKEMITDVQQVAIAALSRMLNISKSKMIDEVLGKDIKLMELTYVDSLKVIRYWNIRHEQMLRGAAPAELKMDHKQQLNNEIRKVQRINRKMLMKFEDDLEVNPDLDGLPFLSMNRFYLGIEMGLKKALKLIN